MPSFSGHASSVWSAVFSPVSARVVTAAFTSTSPQVWDSANGAELTVFGGHTRSVISASFSPDGTRIVTVSDDGTARIWDAKRQANARGEDGGAIVRAWMEEVGFPSPLVGSADR